jgi:hypothetical protein
MIRTNSRSHAVLLEKFRIALDKAENNPGIARELKKIGYGPERIEEGKVLLESTWKIFDANLKKKDEQSALRTKFKLHKKQMDSTFRNHRKRALIIFKNEPVMADKMAVKGKYPTDYQGWMDTMRKFYGNIVNDPEIQERCLRLNLTKKDAEAGLAGIRKMEDLAAKRMLAKGVSEDSTEKKDAAFAKLNDWMSDFYGAGRLALKEEPKLLEALYKSA